MTDQPTTKSQKARAEVCGIYAKAVGEFPLNEVIKNYKRWGTGHKIDGDMMTIGAAHNASQTVGHLVLAAGAAQKQPKS